MQLVEEITNYYLDNSYRLEPDKLFHLGSRLAAWQGSEIGFSILKKSYDLIVQPKLSLETNIANLINTEMTGRRNAHELRQPFFDRYPNLYGLHLALFRVRHLEAIYGINARSALFKNFPEAKLTELKESLLKDGQAIKILSTFAINYLYLLERVVHKNEDSLPIETFYKLGESYDTTNIQEIQLLIYLYTHCIIGESNFYTRNIADDKLKIYQKMLEKLETLIKNNFSMINLDNKLEYLVCTRICHLKTELFKPVYQECADSISPEGKFIIDIHNQNAQNDRNNFNSSEHRNVLFIMSNSQYNPHSTLIGQTDN